MSHTINHLRKLRLQRSELAVPGSNPEMIDKAANSAADFIFLDIEDAVAPPDKERARKNIIQALNDIDWRARGKTVSVRINGLDTHYMYRDVVDVMEQAGDRLDTILVPKVGVPADLYMVEAMVNQIEMAKGYQTRVGLEALIETALGMANVEAIAAFGGRLEALHFGVADYAASCKARTVNIGGLNPDYPGDQWHFAPVAHDGRLPGLWPARHRRSVRRFLRSGRLHGRRPARRGPRHRGQVGDPSLADRACQRRCSRRRKRKSTRARRIIEVLKEAEEQGKGAAALDGKMIDAASERMARNVLVVQRSHRARRPAARCRALDRGRNTNGHSRIPGQGTALALCRPYSARRSGLQPRAGGLSRHARSAAATGSSRRRSIPARAARPAASSICASRPGDRPTPPKPCSAASW